MVTTRPIVVKYQLVNIIS